MYNELGKAYAAAHEKTEKYLSYQSMRATCKFTCFPLAYLLCVITNDYYYH